MSKEASPQTTEEKRAFLAEIGQLAEKDRDLGEETIEKCRQIWLELERQINPETQLGVCEAKAGYSFEPVLRPGDEYVRYRNVFGGDSYRHKPTGLSTDFTTTIIDYEKRKVEFGFGVKHSYDGGGSYSDPDTDPFGAIGSGRDFGFSSATTYYEEVSSLEAPISPEDMPWIHNQVECMIVTYNVPDKTPVLIANINGIAAIIGSWQPYLRAWYLHDGAERGDVSKDIVTYCSGLFQPTPRQLEMAKFQGLALKHIGGPRENVRSLLSYERIPSPHHIDDETLTRAAFNKKQEAEKRRKEREVREEWMRGVRAEREEARILQEAQLATARSSAESEMTAHNADVVLQKLDALDATQEKYNSAFSSIYPKRIEDILKLWNKAAKSTDGEAQKALIAEVLKEEQFIVSLDIELLEEYLDDISAKNWGIYARVRVLNNGEVINVSTGEASSSVRANTSSREFRVVRGRGATRFVPSGNWGEEFALDQGEYVIGRNGSWVYEVAFDDNEVYQVLSKTIGERRKTEPEYVQNPTRTNEIVDSLTRVITQAFVPRREIVEKKVAPHVVGPKRYESFLKYLATADINVAIDTVLNEKIFQSNSREWVNAFCTVVKLGAPSLTQLILTKSALQPSQKILDKAADMIVKDKNSLEGTQDKNDWNQSYLNMVYIAENYPVFREALLAIKEDYYADDVESFVEIVAQVLENIPKIQHIITPAELVDFIEGLI